MTDIFAAAAAGDKDSVEKILSADASAVHAKDSYQMCALHHAAKSNKPEMCEFLISKGAMPSEKQSSGMTAAHMACRLGHLDCLKAIAASKFFEVDTRTRDGKTAKEFAEAAGKTDCAEFLATVEA